MRHCHGLRLDKLLCYLRFARSRSLARKWAEAGHFRCNGQRITSADHCIDVGDTLTMPLRSGVMVIEILALPDRRGSPADAQVHYRRIGPSADPPPQRALDPDSAFAIAGSQDRSPTGRPIDQTAQGHAAP